MPTPTLSLSPKADPLFKLLALLAGTGKVELHNARGEFACNSSSSHSIALIPNLPSHDLSQMGEINDFETSEEFILTDSSAKIRYLAAVINDGQSQDILDDILKELGALEAPYQVSSEGTPSLPRDRFGDSSREFAADLVTFLKRPDVAVMGGEYYGDHPLFELEPESDTLMLSLEGWTARRDTLDGKSWWVLFSDYDGTKLRMSFSEPNPMVEVSKAESPELVDIKVTDRCPFELDCGFCYMGSTRKGAEASLEDVSNLLLSYAEMGVFEIAFGGGEPTLWPPFKDILALTRSLGMVPNFTSKNYNAMKDAELMRHVGAVAFSIIDAKSFDRFQKVYASSPKDRDRKLSLQIIPEIIEDELLEQIFDFCATNYMRLTLLGYKLTGRGGEFDGRIPRPQGFWIPIAQKHRSLRLSIDTTLALNSQESLNSFDVPKWSYHVTEGSFSMYADAVTGRIGASSYVEPSELTAVDLSDTSSLTQELKDNFKDY